MLFLKLTPKSNRARQRVNEHGDTFLFIKHNDNEHKVLVSCRNEHKQDCGWLGWFTDQEADWETFAHHSQGESP